MKPTIPSLLLALSPALPIASAQKPHRFPESKYPITEFAKHLSLSYNKLLDLDMKFYTGLDLNHCIANYQGVLHWAPGGNYYNSCSNCKLDDDTVMTCFCRFNHSSVQTASIDFKNCRYI
ncbi:hypothetical protein GGR53DRAFT_529499 [Hypoxylon sp. FL1150]|nr:hypothetical protein GGR53DRAFT_529499 [Hypoxylon sp. FL1150]